ncbi:hypothetical protein AB205_0133270 [Aquarana catesbeiana]|uniref:Uncharacterized protein n=1 Tax=Aquarana catesbeiana TaxID=8400 RepID=A0A2G9SCU2_AQUCT|nr:hypothetical protein AB205_0133270 [Aquarana catesbeiana]
MHPASLGFYTPALHPGIASLCYPAPISLYSSAPLAQNLPVIQHPYHCNLDAELQQFRLCTFVTHSTRDTVFISHLATLPLHTPPLPPLSHMQGHAEGKRG